MSDEPSMLNGPLCMNIDIISENIQLPPLKRGSVLTIWPVGAYNITQSMQFIRYRSNVVLIDKDNNVYGTFDNYTVTTDDKYGVAVATYTAPTDISALNERNITVDVLPKKLDEEVAAGMVSGFGGVLTTMTDEQADYIGVSKVGPYKPELYRY